jgi:hypothetical protein
MSASPERALRLTFFLVIAVVVGAVLLVPLGIGIWLPDVFVDRVHTLAEARSSNGHSFRVIQYWNHGDFYNTEFERRAPDGSVSTEVLDPDDSKRWRASLTIDERTRLATVALSGRHERSFTW